MQAVNPVAININMSFVNIEYTKNANTAAVDTKSIMSIVKLK